MTRENLEDALAELERELECRSRLFTKLVSTGQLTKTEADVRIRRLGWAIVHIRHTLSEDPGSNDRENDAERPAGAQGPALTAH